MRQSPGLSSSEVAGNICGISRALGPTCQYPMWGVGGGRNEWKEWMQMTEPDLKGATAPVELQRFWNICLFKLFGGSF